MLDNDNPSVAGVEIDNISTNQVVSAGLTSDVPLCLQDADWVVEDFAQVGADGVVPFADFGTVEFNGIWAFTTAGDQLGVTEAKATVKPELRSAKADGVEVKVTGVEARDTCARLIYDGLSFMSEHCKLQIPTQTS